MHLNFSMSFFFLERKVLYFRCQQLWERVADICPKADSPSDKQRVRAFVDRAGGRGLHAERAQSSLTVIFKLVISGLTGIILVVLGTVNLQLGVHFFPFLCSQFLKLWQLMSWTQSGHHVVNFSTWGFGIYKTAHIIWLRILSIALETELKVLDYA